MDSSTQTGAKRSIGQRIRWISRMIIGELFLVAILGGLAWGGYLGFVEMQRSFRSLGERIEANKQRVEMLDDQVARAQAEDSAGKISALQAGAADLDAQLAALQEQMTADLIRQSDLLLALQDDVTAAAAGHETAVADAAALGDAFLALQSDINESNGRIDSLGGEIDGIRAETEAISADLGQFAGTAVSSANLDSLQQTLALFHAWEQIMRARLHLAEDNVGLASDEVEHTLRLIDLLVAAAAEEDMDALELAQTRLSLAFTSLPDDPETAVRDLENAWSQLDAILTARLFPEAALETEPTPTPEPSPSS